MNNLSYIHHSVQDPLKYLTLGNLAEHAAQQHGNVIAAEFIEQERRVTYSEAVRQADTFSVGLLKLGLEKGDKLGLWSPNCLEWYIVHLACIRIGVLVVALNTAATKSDMDYSINNVGIKFIVCPYVGKHNKHYEQLMELAPELKKVDKKNFTSCNLPSLKGIILTSNENTKNAYSYIEVMNIGTENPQTDISAYHNKINPDDICYIHLSSGTTGKSKIIPISHFQALNNSYFLAKRLEFNKKCHSVCIQNPLFHIFGTVLAIGVSWHFGTTLVFPSNYYNSTKNLEAITNKKCSFVYGTPTMFIDLINIQKNANFNLCIEGALVAGSPCPADLLIKMRSILGIKTIKNAYGLTEASGVVCVTRPGEQPDNDIIGYPMDHFEIKIIGDNGDTLPIGVRGEVCVRGYSVMRGYYCNKEATKNVIQNSGWLRTSDIGILESTGHVKIVGRTSDLIIRGGVNIYPTEIEDVLTTHPDIIEAQVLGMPHMRLGEEICACVKLRSSCNLSMLDISDFCKQRISSYKIPTQLRILEEFPRTSTGKVQKNLLREQICNQ